MAHKERSGDLKFKSIRLLKEHPLGVGSYGSVFRANCDDLVCAAKIIHPTLVPTGLDQPSISAEKVHRLPIKRFEAECSFMKEIRHPYIVQYLGMFQDQETGLPVLLLELMDESLNHFLENESEVTVPYSIQLKLCSDVTCALSFLHSNEIVHRDLSSNNILLIGRYQAKLSDFGMAKFLSQNSSQISNTLCPGTDAYMPPEALDNSAIFTAKGDTFSFGVNMIQILTRKFPAPGDRFKTLHIDHPQIPQGSIDVRVSEVERRIVHINSVESSHPLLPIALGCLKDKAQDRPTASELCKRFRTLKTQIRPQQETAEHVHDVQQIESTDKNFENEKLKQEIEIQAKQLNVLQQKLQAAKGMIMKQVASSEPQSRQNEYLEQDTKDQKRADTESTKVDTTCILPPALPPKGIQKHQPSKQKVGIRKSVPLLSTEMHRSNTTNISATEPGLQLPSTILPIRPQTKPKVWLRKTVPLDTHTSTKSTLATTDCSKHEREKPLSKPELRLPSTTHSVSLTWKRARNAPIVMSRDTDAVINGSTVYLRPHRTRKIYFYNSAASLWLKSVNCLTDNTTLTVIDGFLTTVGGTRSSKLFTLTQSIDGRLWTEKFPSMGIERSSVTAISNASVLIVIGGLTVTHSGMQAIRSVEVLNTDEKQWATAVDIPQPLYACSGQIVNSNIYLLGGLDKSLNESKIVYSCSVVDLLISCRTNAFLQKLKFSSKRHSTLWSSVEDVPVLGATCVNYHNHLLAIGGRDTKNIPTNNVHVYDKQNDTWHEIEPLNIPRALCFAATLHNDTIFVIGGIAPPSKFGNVSIESIELGMTNTQ